MKDGRRPSLKDVAQQAGVSVMAASAALGGNYPTVRVSEETRERVRAIAREMGYHPNALARSLRRKRTDIIGLYCGEGFLRPDNPFQAELILGIQSACMRREKDLLVHIAFSSRPALDIYESLHSGRVDGLATYQLADPALIERLAAANLPVVALVEPVSTLPAVVVDDRRGMEMVFEHLAARGHQHVLFRSLAEQDATPSVIRRREGAYAAATRLGLRLEEWRPCLVDDDTQAVLAAWHERDPAERPTAIACWNDGSACTALRACRLLGIRVPEDLAVAGFDGIAEQFLGLVGAPFDLTTIEAPWRQVGSTAVDLLAALSEGESVPPETMLPVKLHVGRTT